MKLFKVPVYVKWKDYTVVVGDSPASALVTATKQKHAIAQEADAPVEHVTFGDPEPVEHPSEIPDWYGEALPYMEEHSKFEEESARYEITVGQMYFYEQRLKALDDEYKAHMYDDGWSDSPEGEALWEKMRDVERQCDEDFKRMQDGHKVSTRRRR